MAIYVNNAPIVFDSLGGDKYISLEIDGNIRIDGKKVVEWNSIDTNASWLTIIYDEEQYEDGYYYSFELNADSNTQLNQRYAICYLEYVLEDGTSKKESFYVYQEGKNTITIAAGENPTNFSSSIDTETVTICYSNTNSSANINNAVGTSQFSVTPRYGWDETGSYYIDYDIQPSHYNVTPYSITDSIRFSYINPTTSVEEYFMLHLGQMGCYYPFDLTKADGSAIPTEKYMAQPAYKRWRDIPFGSNSVQLKCYFPFANDLRGNVNVSLNQFYENTATLSISESYETYLGSSILCHTYTVKFAENYETYSKRVDLNVTYTTLDGIVHSDSVQLYQNASDGSNVTAQILTNVDELKFNYRGKPNLYDSIDVTWVGNYTEKYAMSDADWLYIGEPTLVKDDGTYNKTYSYKLTVDLNETSEPRTGYLYFQGDHSNGVVEKIVTVIQAKYNREEIIEPEIPVDGNDYCGPIWKDIEFSFGNIDTVNYNIYVKKIMYDSGVSYDEDVLVFSGKSCKRPESETNTILVNKICQNYLETPILIKGAIGNRYGYNVFKLTDESGNITYRTYRFVNDWSYTDDFKTGVLSHPILNDRTVVRNQMLPFTVFGAAEQIAIPFGIIYRDDFTDDYGNIVSNWNSTIYAKNEMVTEYFPYSKKSDGVDMFYIDDTEWKVVDDCKVDYVLYYVNPWGGYDWFPIKGKSVEIDNITQYVYTQNYTNTSWDFGKRRYLSEINKKYQLHTHWLREDESKRMWYLLQSNTVYLHNIKENRIDPVIITATEQEHKKRGIVSSRIQYQIEVELSQMRERI